MPLTPGEQALATLLQQKEASASISITDVNTCLPRRFGYRSNQPAIQKLFDSAQRLNIGVRQGQANQAGAPLRLDLTLDAMEPRVRQRLGLPLNQVTRPLTSCAEGEVPALREATNPLPRMSGGGTNCRKALEVAQADASHPSLRAQVVTADSPVILAMCWGGKRAAEAQPNGRCAQAKAKCAAARARLPPRQQDFRDRAPTLPVLQTVRPRLTRQIGSRRDGRECCPLRSVLTSTPFALMWT